MTLDAQRLLQQALLGEAFDQVDGLAVFVWNEERRYVAVNEEACRLVGLTREKLIGMPVGDMSPGKASADMARVKAGTVTNGTSSFTRADGEGVPIEWTTTHTRVAGLPYMVSIVWRASR